MTSIVCKPLTMHIPRNPAIEKGKTIEQERNLLFNVFYFQGNVGDIVSLYNQTLLSKNVTELSSLSTIDAFSHPLVFKGQKLILFM